MKYNERIFCFKHTRDMVPTDDLLDARNTKLLFPFSSVLFHFNSSTAFARVINIEK